jgi:hypothetical protein
MNNNLLPGMLVCVDRKGALGYSPGEPKSHILKQNSVAIVISTRDFLNKWPGEVLIFCHAGIVEIEFHSLKVIK